MSESGSSMFTVIYGLFISQSDHHLSQESPSACALSDIHFLPSRLVHLPLGLLGLFQEPGGVLRDLKNKKARQGNSFGKSTRQTNRLRPRHAGRAEYVKLRTMDLWTGELCCRDESNPYSVPSNSDSFFYASGSVHLCSLLTGIRAFLQIGIRRAASPRRTCGIRDVQPKAALLTRFFRD
ncbi:uncharacterized protein FOMMEDRAFT_166726 [Fomitiporia mediterranea MF3/22]|uniref:uncharacterized protein n=1 Tax=Fomitiporia mediterranea (strain MF3/22) TaxID=694068 RepID=UPI0004407E44|nr:uncharacterized protein FOMMEDRAFT_166726 [Fomitiporia mediterranea MF3/22]EJD05024.1 hypothetical protein FOMMEDRAFT_166726 [Fomitiporia mediterranea MF3/22]